MNKKDFDKIFVMDTNVLLHDSNSIYKFENNLIVIPMCVLEELDHFKKGQDETARNSRQFSRHMDEIRKKGYLKEGVLLKTGGFLKVRTEEGLSDLGMDKIPDNKIIATALKEKEKNPDKKVIIVSKDINLRVKADILGIPAEDYFNDKVNFEEMYTGVLVHEIFEPIVPDLYTFKEIDLSNLPNLPKMYPNQYLVLKYGGQKGLARYDATKNKLVSLLGAGKTGVWGIQPKNLEQTLALDMLLSNDIQLVTLIGKAGTGKSQPISEPVLTPSGYKPMGSITPGECAIGKDGKPTKVLSIHPQGELDIFEVSFSDGSSTRCSEDHLWYTKTALERDYGRQGQVRTTKEIADTLTYDINSKKNHSIPMADTVEFDKRDVLLDPYLLGTLVGDGCLNRGIMISSSDQEIIDEVTKRLPPSDVLKYCSKYDYQIKRKIRNTEMSETKKCILEYKLNKKSNLKFIPEDYKFNCASVRLDVLQGLLDTYGTLDYRTGKNISYTSVSFELANDVKFLVESFGGNATIRANQKFFSYKGEKKKGQISYNVAIRLPEGIVPFKLKRKSEQYLPNDKYIPIRYIVNVVPCGKELCQCIKVEAENSLYLTNNFIVTHNTLLSVAAGFHKTLTNEDYKKIVISRPIVPMGKDLGYLPGTLAEKMDPWMKPIFDNVDFLLNGQNTTGKGFCVSGKELLDQGMMEVEPLTYIRGRSIPNQYLMIDECFPYDQRILTDQGKFKIGFLNGEYVKNKTLPKALSYNTEKNIFEYKQILNAVHKGKKKTVQVISGNKKIKCTDNHPFLTTSGWKKACDLVKGDYLYVYGDNLQNSRWLNNDQLQVALGSYLGDGSLQKVSEQVYRLKIIHGDNQSNYLKHKSSIFNRKENVKYLEKNGYSQKRASSFNTLCFGLPIGFNETVKLNCNLDIFKYLDEKGLAVWFMDDGSAMDHGCGARLHTESFTKESCEFITLNLKDKFNLDAKVLNYTKRNKTYHYIVLSKESYTQLCILIAPYVHQDLSYKIKDYHKLNGGSYTWDNTFPDYFVSPFTELKQTEEFQHVFDLEVEDNHNFIACIGSNLEKNQNGFIVHNCQNLTPHEIKTIITRAGTGTKIILTGDCYQIDNPFLDASSNGLAYVVERFKKEKIAAHITLLKGERSELAEIASNIL